MQSKLFSKDKNYILKQAQLDLRTSLLDKIIDRVIYNYLKDENPMGIVDSFVQSIETASRNAIFLSEMYDTCSHIYRYINPDNQLEILWDGRSHYDKYTEKWTSGLLNWVDELGRLKNFNRIIIKGAVLGGDTSNSFLGDELRRIVLRHFGFRFSTKGKLKRVA